jgi:polyisoprenyl-teichoic acid--peptidoglycan teichoic acid transferase
MHLSRPRRRRRSVAPIGNDRTRIARTRPAAGAWAAMAIALLLAACGGPAPATPTSSLAFPSASAAELPASPGTASPGVSPSPTPTASPSPSAPDLAARPFTVLILGGDNGYRTDSIIIAGIDPVSRRVGFVSLPRDTIDVPIPGGGVFRDQKVNAFYNYAAAHPSAFPQGPGRATADMMESLLRIRVDYYAITTFNGFNRLIDAMGGVRINVPKSIVDHEYQLPSGRFGIVFRAGPQTMNGARAQVYARTRHGDSDFERSRRQQAILVAAGQQLLAKPGLLVGLLAAGANLTTDFPLDQVPQLLAAIGSVPAGSISTGLVLGPTTYSSLTPCACGYALEPNAQAMRRAVAKLFPWAAAAP